MERDVRTFRSSLVMCLVAILGTAAPSVRAQEYVQFDFAPPTPLRFHEEHIFKKEILLGLDQPETEFESSETQYDLRRTGSRYVVVATPIQSEELTENGANLLNAFLTQGIITYDLDDAGRLTGVRGADQAYRALRETLSPQMTDAVLAAFGVSGQSANQMAGNLWNNRLILGQFVGRRFKMDTLYSASGEFPLPAGGIARGDIEMVVVPGECTAGECVKIFTTYRSTDQSVAERMTTLMRALTVGVGQAFLEQVAADPELRRALEEEAGARVDLNTDIDALVPHFQIVDAHFTSENLRLMDPRTGLLYSEVEIQTMEAGFGISGEAVTQLVFKQTHSYDYTYQR